jgi:type IV conjugative transfer system coupling protein TraD
MSILSSNKTKQFTRGGQIVFHNLRMLLQINKAIWNGYLIGLVVIFCFSMLLIVPKENLVNARCWGLAKIDPALSAFNIGSQKLKCVYRNKDIVISPKYFLKLSPLINSARETTRYLKYAALITAALGGLALYIIGKWLTFQGKKQEEDKYIRGSKLDNPEKVAKMLKKDRVASDIKIDKIPLAKDSETRSILVHGRTGSGKTQLICKLMDNIRRRGDRAIIYDMSGIYTSLFYRDYEDKLLNPFDVRSENWDLWEEAATESDFKNFAEHIVTEKANSHSDPFWTNATRQVLTSAAFKMRGQNERSIKSLLDLLLISDLGVLHEYLKDTPAAQIMCDEAGRTAGSIRTIINTYLPSLIPLINLTERNKDKFSVQKWMLDSTSDLFITSRADKHSSIQSLIELWLSTSMMNLLSLSPSAGRRLWFILDELPSLHHLKKLSYTMNMARKYGGCFVIGMQGISQIEGIYGISEAKSLLNATATKFFFGVDDDASAETVSRLLGKQERAESQETYSYGANTIRDGITIASQTVRSNIVEPSELLGLEALECYVRLPLSYPAFKLKLQYEDRTRIAPELVEIDTNLSSASPEHFKLASCKLSSEMAELSPSLFVEENDKELKLIDKSKNLFRKLEIW